MSSPSFSGITEGTKLDVNGNVSHDILNSPSYHQEKIRMKKRNHSKSSRHKPYELVDDLGLSKLTIGLPPKIRQSGARGSPPLTNVSKKGSPDISRTKSLVSPAKLNLLTRKASSDVNSNFQLSAEKGSFDFASLAAQVSGIEQSTDTELVDRCSLQVTAARYDTKQYSTLRTSLAAEVANSDYQDELSSLPKLSLSGTDASHTGTRLIRSCSREAMLNETDFSAEELAYYFDELVHIPKKMSEMAEMMYT